MSLWSFPNYKYDGYRGDAKEQALIYKKNKQKAYVKAYAF